MAYIDDEKSISDGIPVELFKFTYGSLEFFYTSANVPIIYDGDTYENILIKRGTMNQTGEAEKNELDIEVHRTNLYASQFLAHGPEIKNYLTVYRGHNDDWVISWFGQVVSYSFNDETAEIKAAPISRGLNMSGIRRKYQRLCAYDLYGTKCSVAALNYQIQSNVATIVGRTVTANAFSGQPNGWFVGGRFISGITQRMITQHVGTSVTLTGVIPEVSVGDIFTAQAGCSHKYSTCSSKFNNRINYGGLPYLPTDNPFELGLANREPVRG